MKKTILLYSLAAIVAFVVGLKEGQPNDLQNSLITSNKTVLLWKR